MAEAEKNGLDLVEVSPNAKPPVCRIMDYGKYKYLMSKKAHEAKKKQTVIHVKEVKLRVKTEEHDFQFKLRNARRFLNQGDKVKVALFFRGREITHKDLGMKMLKRMVEEVKDIAAIEQHPKMEGRSMMLVMAPLQPKTKKVASGSGAGPSKKEGKKEGNKEGKKEGNKESKNEEKKEAKKEATGDAAKEPEKTDKEEVEVKDAEAKD